MQKCVGAHFEDLPMTCMNIDRANLHVVMIREENLKLERSDRNMPCILPDFSLE